MHGIALIVFIIAKPAIVLLPEGQRDNSLGARHQTSPQENDGNSCSL